MSTNCMRAALLRGTALAGSLCIALWTGPALAQAQTYAFDIPAEPLSTALREYARVSGRQIIFTDDLVAGKSAPVLHGSYSSDEALSRLLAGTTLITEQSPTGAIMVRPKNVQAARDEGAVNATLTVETVVVTGTHIHGGNPTVNAKVLDQQYIESTGYASVTDLVNSLPENSGAGFNPISASISPSPGAAGNVGLVSSVNLHGLGSDSTLVLVNGSRLAPNGSGGVVDVSAIPLSAVRQVEILPDGASAIYGSDAVGGVVNFILDKDFEGALTSAQYGASPEGAPSELRLSQKLGTQWNDGGGMIAYEYYDRTALNVEDRQFSSTIPAGFSLVPATSRNSLVASVHQDITGALIFSADGLYSSTRNTLIDSYAGADARNKLEALSIDGSLAWQIDPDWNVELGAAYGAQVDHLDQMSPSVPEITERFSNSVFTADFRVDGTLFDLPAGPVKLASGLEYRKEAFEMVSSLSVPLSPDRTVEAGYVEVLVPIAGDRARYWGAVDADVAVRVEHYSDFGSTTNPKIGLSWQNPVFHVHANWGTSFEAPSFYDLDQPNFSVLADLPDPTTGSTTRSLIFFGGNPDLKPQTATTWSAAIDYGPTSIPGLRVGADYFNVKYDHRIQTPEGSESLFDVLPNEAVLGPQVVVRNPGPALISQLLSRSGSVVYNLLGPAFSGEPYTPAQFQTLIYDQNLNLSSSFTDGIDAHAEYEFGTSLGRFNATLNATLLLHQQSQVTQQSPVQQQLNRLFYSPTFRGRAGLSWSSGDFTASTYVNYASRYLNTTLMPSQSIRDSATVDLTLRYAADQFVSGLSVTASVRNLFDEAPPPVTTPTLYNGGQFGFDPSNGDPIGRFLGLAISEKW